MCNKVPTVSVHLGLTGQAEQGPLLSPVSGWLKNYLCWNSKITQMWKMNKQETEVLLLEILQCLLKHLSCARELDDWEAVKKVMLTEAVHSKAPSTLTSALLAELREDEANVRLLGITCHGKGPDCKSSQQIRGLGVLFVFGNNFVATKSSQVLLNFPWRFWVPFKSRLR